MDEELNNKLLSLLNLLSKEQLNKINPEDYLEKEWLLFEKHLLHQGRYSDALICRNNALKISESVQAAIHLGDLELTIERWTDHPIAAHYLKLWTKDQIGIGLRNELKWYQYLEGKSVNIVGPTEREDVATDLKFMVAYENNYELDCDVVYANHLTWPRIPWNEAHKRYAFVVSKGSEFQDVPNGRTMINFSWLFYNGARNQIPQMLLDATTGFPKRIVVSGSNFYAGKSYLIKGKKRPVLSDIAHHNPFSNRRIVKNLFDAGVIEADKPTAEVLKLTDEQYAQRLDKLAHLSR